MYSYSVISENIAVNDTMPKTAFFGFVLDSMGLILITVTFGSKTAEFDEITQNNGHCAVQGQVSSLDTNGKLICDFHLVRCIVSEVWRTIGQIFVDKGCLSYSL